jgi:hypothetical protein
MNPVPDADIHSIGQANFDWIVKEVADLAIAKAKASPNPPKLRSAVFLGAETAPAKSATKKAASKKKAASTAG